MPVGACSLMRSFSANAVMPLLAAFFLKVYLSGVKKGYLSLNYRFSIGQFAIQGVSTLILLRLDWLATVTRT